MTKQMKPNLIIKNLWKRDPNKIWQALKKKLKEWTMLLINACLYGDPL